MKILSLFDGISCARVALDRAGFSVDKYYASEIDKYAIQIAQKNYPDTIQVGDVSALTTIFLVPGETDLLIGGSPCQDLSIANKDRKGLDGERSGLFWQYVRILNEIKPKYFILENVNSMPKEAKELITKTLGVEPIMINAALVSAQNRKRLFWTNIPNVKLPQDRGILLKDVLEKDYEQIRRVYKTNGKAPTLPTGTGGGVMTKIAVRDKLRTLRTSGFGSGINDKHNWQEIYDGISVRKLTPVECERLQSLPDSYTEGVSNTQRYKCLGNAFNVDVVAHILSFIPNE